MKIRKPLAHGILYPSRAGELSQLVRHLLEAAEGAPRKPAAVLSPHGGYGFFGSLMAAAYSAAAQAQPDLIVLLGPVHREFRNAVFVPEADVFETPLGRVEVPRSSAEGLAASGGPFVLSDMPHEEEHCLELQLPFLQDLFPGVPVLPLLLGEQSLRLSRTVCSPLKRVISEGFASPLFVLTGNASGWLPPAAAREEADRFAKALVTASPVEIMKTCRNSSRSPCAAGLVAFMLTFSPGLTPVILEGESRPGYNDGEEMVAAIAASFEEPGL